MSDELTVEPAAPPEDRADDGGVISGYGVAAAALGLLAVAAVVLGGLIWSAHRSDVAELDYRTRVLQAAADWTSLLINLSPDNVDATMEKLHEGTVGQLNTDFDAAVQPFRQLVAKLQSHTTGQVDSVSIESIYHPPQGRPGGPPVVPQPDAQVSALSSRTDTVLVVATSVTENAGAKPQTVRWTLRLGISDVDGKLMVSRLDTVR